MTEHDPVDAWLDRDVRPLPPPAGTLERIRVRARRRKRNQALMAAAGCAVVVAAAVTGPQLASALHGSAGAGPGPGPVAAGSSVPSARPTGPGSVTPEVSRATPEPQHSTLTPGQPARDPVPPGFQPTSVTFAGTGSGGVVGAVLGQAGGGKCATRFCTSLAQTPDYGKTWFGLAAPLTGPPPASTGVSQVRFADLRHGWAFGPGLWETSSGGWPWYREGTGGQRVTDVEAAGRYALAIFATCSGGGRFYAADCTSFSLHSSVAGSRSWTTVAIPAGTMSAGQASAASLVIAEGKTGYLLTPSGDVLSGPVSGGSWTDLGPAPAPCKPAGVLPNGQPDHAQLAATGGELMLACEGFTGPPLPRTQFYTSPDGAHWTLVGTVPDSQGSPTSLASAGGQTVLATTAAIYYSADDGRTWHVGKGSVLAGGGYDFVGMTNGSQGVAVPDDPKLGEIFVTSDGGRHWTASAVTSQ